MMNHDPKSPSNPTSKPENIGDQFETSLKNIIDQRPILSFFSAVGIGMMIGASTDPKPKKEWLLSVGKKILETPEHLVERVVEGALLSVLMSAALSVVGEQYLSQSNPSTDPLRNKTYS